MLAHWVSVTHTTSTKENTMKLFIAGFITCFVVMTIGFSGLGQLGDNLMNKGQSVVKEAAK